MILLDTNVISAVMAPKPLSALLNWLNENDTVSLYISTITVAEISYGLRVLPAGKRRRTLENRFESFIAKGFEQRMLNFDDSAARQYAEVMGYRKETGRPMGILDGQIAAIAHVSDLILVTVNVKDFAWFTDLKVENWMKRRS